MPCSYPVHVCIGSFVFMDSSIHRHQHIQPRYIEHHWAKVALYCGSPKQKKQDITTTGFNFSIVICGVLAAIHASETLVNWSPACNRAHTPGIARSRLWTSEPFAAVIGSGSTDQVFDVGSVWPKLPNMVMFWMFMLYIWVLSVVFDELFMTKCYDMLCIPTGS